MSTEGQFIVFEGPDGSGKTTALQMVADKLRQQGEEVLVTREPGGTPFAEKIRELVLLPSQSVHERDVDVDMLLVYGARAQHLETRILPALRHGVTVLCDRFSASTYAYQVGAGCANPDKFWVLEDNFVQRQPDTYLYLTAPLEQRLARMRERAGETTDRFDDVAELIYEPMENAYETFFKEAPMRKRHKETTFTRVDASQDQKAVRDACLGLIKSVA